MLDILTIVHSFADIQTASRLRQTCRRLGALTPQPILYSKPNSRAEYKYKIDDKLHRLDGPAICIHGAKKWYRGGIEHREYHPQCIGRYDKRYMVEGMYHREAGPSYVIGDRGLWYMRNKLHRKAGPADPGNLYMWERWDTLDELHRLDGPAYINIYAIRGVYHSISNSMHDGKWIVNDQTIRTYF